jgi:hypothetical protein
MNKNTLFLIIKKKYFDQILSGEKTCEYREFKDYYIKKFTNKKYDNIVLQVGYSKKSERLKAKISEISVKKMCFETDIFSGNLTVFEISLLNPKKIR